MSDHGQCRIRYSYACDIEGNGVTNSLHWRRVLGLPVAAVAVMSALAVAQGADLLPAPPPPAPPPYAAPPAPPLVQPAAYFYDPYRIEVRLGGFLHGVGGAEKGTYDLNPELVFPRLPFFQTQWWNVFVPRPHVGGMINLEGRTSDLYAGALWSFPLPYHTFFELFVDGAIHNGVENNPAARPFGPRLPGAVSRRRLVRLRHHRALARHAHLRPSVERPLYFRH